MRVLFDQGTPVEIVSFLTKHTVRTTRQQGWDTLSNGDLLLVAEETGFEVMLTTDNGLAYQQNLRSRKIAIVVLSRNRWRMVQRMIRKIVAAVDAAEPGGYVVIDIPVKITDDSSPAPPHRRRRAAFGVGANGSRQHQVESREEAR